MKFDAKDYETNDTFKFIRQGLSLTQKELAKEINIGKSSIEKYESGKVDFTFATLVKIAKKYNLSIIIKDNN